MSMSVQQRLPLISRSCFEAAWLSSFSNGPQSIAGQRDKPGVSHVELGQVTQLSNKVLRQLIRVLINGLAYPSYNRYLPYIQYKAYVRPMQGLCKGISLHNIVIYGTVPPFWGS